VNALLASVPLSSADVTPATLAPGSSDQMRAATPGVCGVAIEVPLKYEYPPPRTVLRVRTPGAARSTELEPKLEKPARPSFWSLAATHTMFAAA